MSAESVKLVFYFKLIIILVYLRPDLVCEQRNFPLSVNTDELLGAKYFPNNSVLIQVIEENSWVPAIGCRVSLSFHPILTASFLLEVCCEDNSLAYSIVFTFSNCVNHCRVDKLFLALVISPVEVPHKGVKHVLLRNAHHIFTVIHKVASLSNLQSLLFINVKLEKSDL